MELNYLYDIEITPKDIFNSMKKNIYKNFSNSSFSSISKEYLSIRKDLFSLIKKISGKMSFKSQTYFLSIYYLDILFSQNKKIDCNPNILGLACLLLSAKYCENDPAVPELKYFIRIYNRIVGSKNSISVSDLFYSEVITIKMLNHKLNYYTVYDFNSFFFSHNILKQEQLEDLNSDYNNNQSKDSKFSKKGKKILEKIYRKSRYYLDNLLESPISLKYNTVLLSIYLMKKSIEITLLNEKNFDKHDFSLKDKYLKKTNEYFNSIIKGYYGIDYEKFPDFPKLLEEYDFIKIFKQIKKAREDFSPINNKKENKAYNTSTSFNKTPNKCFNMKPLNQRILEIPFSSSKKNFNKLKSSNSIHSKMYNANSLISFSGQNMPRVSYNQNINLNQKTFFRNLGVDNCTENYKQQENINSEKIINSKDESNNLLHFFKLSSIYGLNHNSKLAENNSECMLATSPLKFGNSNKYLNNNNSKNYNDNSLKKDTFIKKTKTKDFEKTNYNKSIEKNILNQNTNNMNANANSNKPYYKKVVQNCGNKLKNFNQISNKLNLDINNNDDKNLNSNKKEKNEITKTLYNIVNRMPKYKINNNTNKEETYNDSTNRININKRYSLNVNRDINISNNKKDHQEKNENNSKIKEKKICQLLNINLNPKLSDNKITTPLGSLFVNKKNKEDYFSTTTYINKANTKKKKFETKTVKSMNNLAKSIDNKINNFKINNLNQNINYLLSKKSSDLNLGLKDNNHDSKDFYNEKKKLNFFLDSNENIFSNTLSSNYKQVGKYSLLSLQIEKEKEKEKNNNKSSNKIILTDYTHSGDENMNNLEEEINNISEVENTIKFNNKSFKSQLANDSKRIQVKKNNFENEYYIRENYINFKKKKQKVYRGYTNQSSDFRNYEESNDEDSSNFNQRNLLIFSNQIEEDNNLNNIAQQFKKNPSTIVINNNININFGNKTGFGLKDKKRYKNLIKNSNIQINNNNGPNSISSLLNKIPLCYKNSEANVNVRKKKPY